MTFGLCIFFQGTYIEQGCVAPRPPMGINTMSDQRFVWVIQHFANPQGGTDMYDKIPHYRYGFV